MKRRKKKNNFNVRFCEVPTKEFVVFDSFDSVDSVDVNGKFVKISPVINSVDYKGVDVDSIRKNLKDRGALSVLIAPSVVSVEKGFVEDRSCKVDFTDYESLVDEWLDINSIYFKNDDIKIRIKKSIMNYLEDFA